MLNFLRNDSSSVGTLRRGAGVAFVAQVAALGLGYFGHVLLARWMGVAEYGTYVYTLGWAVPLSAIGGLGVHMIALRFVPEYHTSGETGLLRGAFRIGSSVAFFVGAAVSLLSVGVALTIRSEIPDTIMPALLVALCVVPLLSLTYFNANYLKALKRVGLASLSDIMRPPLLVIGAAIWLTAKGGVSSKDVLSVLGGTLAVVAVVQHLLIRRSVPAGTWTTPSRTDIPAWKAAIGAMLLIEIFQAIMIKADVLLIGAMMDVEAVAVFGVAARVSGLVGFVVAAVGTIAGPMFTELHSQDERVKLESLVRTAGHWMLWPAILFAIGLAVFAPYVLGLFGPDFARGSSVLWILLAAQVAHAAAGPVFVLITFTGFHEHSARIYGYMLALNIVLNVIGINWLGLHGAALAAFLTAACWGVLLHRAVSSNLGLAASPLLHFGRATTESDNQ